MIRRLGWLIVLGFLMFPQQRIEAGNILKDLFKIYQTYEQVNMMLWLTGDAKAEKRFGEEAKWFINLTNKKEKDAEANRWVRSVFDRVKPQFRDRGFDYNITILQGNEVNAFAIPGGSIFVYTGMLKFVNSDDELAAILAHELAHSERRHSLKQLRQNAAFQVLLQAAVKNQRDRETWGAVVGALTSLKFSREDEREADAIGQEKMFQAGFDPAAQVLVWEKFVQKFGKGESGILKYLGTHPPSQERVQHAREALPKFNTAERKDFQLSYNILSDTVENMLQNGSFENDTLKRDYADAWTKREGISRISNEFACSGKVSMELTAENQTRPVRVISDFVPFKPGERLILRGRVRSSDGSQKVAVGAEIYDAQQKVRGYVWPGMTTGEAENGWMPFEGLFTSGKERGKSLPPETALIRILLQNGPLSKGKVWFDDLSVRHEGVKTDNLLPDGDFEISGKEGLPKGIIGTSGCVTRNVEKYRTGYAAARMSSAGEGKETELEFTPLALTGLPAGKTVQISWHYCGSAEMKGRVVIEMVDESGNSLSRRLLEREFTAKPNLWQSNSGKFELKLTPEESSGARALAVRVISAIPAGQALWVDGFVMR